MQTISKEELYHDFLLLRKMKSSTSKRVRMLTELMSQNENHWQVVGITENALDVFASHNFKRVSKMGINRSHIVDRHKTYTRMLEGPLLDLESWWDFYTKNDKTILATSTENKRETFSKIYEVDENLGLFKSKGFAWAHKEPEVTFLKETYIKLESNNAN